ncbi:MAG TPA: hypothetical protein VFA57_03655 [Pseudolabrys sp.]|nr:hypothetical protein [Pseudolabrys sp.]
MAPFDPAETAIHRGAESVEKNNIRPITKVLQFITSVLDNVSELDTERYMAEMANNDAIPNAVSEAFEKVRREAYAAGWKAAMAAVSKAASELVDPQTVDDIEGGISDLSTPTARAGDPKAGSTPWWVLQAIRKRNGMTGAEVVSVVTEGGHKVSEASIRTSLIRLERRKLIESRHKRWYPKGA